MPHLNSSLCPKCFASNVSGYSQLLVRPRKKSLLRTLLRKKKLKRASTKDKALLSAVQHEENVLVLRCGKCNYKKFSILEKPLTKKQVNLPKAKQIPKSITKVRFLKIIYIKKFLNFKR